MRGEETVQVARAVLYSIQIEMHERKVCRNMRAHNFVNLNIFVCQLFRMNPMHSFIHMVVPFYGCRT